MAKVADIIGDLGGPSKVAGELGLPVTTVHTWGRVNHIPAWRQPAIIDLAKTKGKKLTAESFPVRRKAAA